MSEEYLVWLGKSSTNEHFKDPEVRDIIYHLVDKAHEWKIKYEKLEKERRAIVGGVFKK